MTQEAGKSKEQEAAWQEHIRKMHPSWHKDVYKDFFIAGIEYAQQREQPWVRVSDRLPTEDDSYDDYNEVLTIQIGRQRPTMMKYWEIKHCPFTTHWMKLPPAPHKQ